MTSDLYTRSDNARQQYVRALSSAIRAGEFRGLSEPAVWLQSHPEIEEKILRDAVFGGAINKRCHKVAGRDWDTAPGEEGDPMGARAAEVGKRLLRNIRKFTDARANLAQAFFRGRRHAKIHFQSRQMDIGDGRPRTWRVPIRLEDQDKRQFRQITKVDQNTGAVEAWWQRWNIGKNEWLDLPDDEARHTVTHTYQDSQGTLGHGAAVRESLGWLWYAKTHTGQETLQAIEKYANGIMIAKVSGMKSAAAADTNDTIMQAYLDTLEDVRARHVTAIDADDEVQFVMPNGTGWELIKWFWGELKTEAIELILGSNLPTSANKGGSYALGDVQSHESNELIDHDREILEETISDDVIRACWYENWPNVVELGIADSMPRFAITQKKRQDPKQVADLVAVLSSSGVPLALADVYEKVGFRKPEEGEPVVKAPAPQNPNGMFPQLPGFGGGGIGQ